MKPISICALSLVVVSTFAVPAQWRVEDGGNGHWYERVGDFFDVDSRVNWRDANALSEARTHEGATGHLLTVTSQAEHQFILDTFLRDHPWPLWIGFTDLEEFGGHESSFPDNSGWVWVTGEPVTFSVWGPGSPDQTQVDEDAALYGSIYEEYGRLYQWNDAQPGDHAAFLVEYEAPVPVPDSLPFAAAIAFVALAGMRRVLK